MLHRGAGAYICGEETALLESLEGKRGQPRSKPPFPAIAGLYASPTLSQQRRDDRDGAADHRDGRRGVREARRRELDRHARSSRSRATSRAAATTSCRLGTPLRELIYDIGGGIPDGRELKAVIPGGSSVPVLTADQIDATLDFDSLADGSARCSAPAR